MMKPSKYAAPVNDEQYFQLKEMLSQSSGSFYTRIKGIILSLEGYAIDEIAHILNVHRNTVSIWIDSFENNGIDGLKLKKGQGRKMILSAEKEQDIAVKAVKNNPRQIKKAIEEIKAETGKEISSWTLKRLLKKKNMIWKRVRKSLKSKQDTEKAEQAKKDINILEIMEKNEEIEIYYMDESGFDLTPTVPYAWQDSGRDNTIQIPSSRSNRINVLGFMDTKNNLVPFLFENSIDTPVALTCFHEFAKTITTTTVVIIDNAPIHTSNEFMDCIEKWQAKGLYLYFIPPYSPEFNKIEILWRKMKYEWMPFSAYNGMKELRNSIQNILIGFGSIYKINFA